MIKIENEQIIDLCEMAIDIRRLTCKICYCVLILPVQCPNIKCAAIFCNECIKNSLLSESVCPFCRLNVEFINVDQNINFILNNLRVFCQHNSCKSPYKIDHYVKHNKDNLEQFPKCFSCTESNVIRCHSCQIYTCSECMFILYCKWCNKNICIKCNKNYYIHSQCDIIDKCANCNKINDNSLSSCCNKILCNDCFKVCSECNIKICKKGCILNDKSCFHEKVNNSDFCCSNSLSGLNTCKSCNQPTCSSSFCHQKCVLCKAILCSNCYIKCNICKDYICKKCSISCDVCEFSNPNSYSCSKCNILTLKNCSEKNCNKKLCINCWKVCNACSIIYCEAHSIKCSCCEESVCEKHIYKCELCEYKGKICLKNCVYKCENCSNVSTPYCDKDKHTFVYNMKCRHLICEKCTRRCSNCFNPVNQNFFCPICVFSFYEKKILHCNFCKVDYCYNCFRFCRYCDQYYCLFNKCINCNVVIKKCTNCIVMKSRLYCVECKAEEFKICEECNAMLICSMYCYVEYMNKVDHICQMFNCKKCMDIKIKENRIVRDTEISVIEDLSNYSIRSDLNETNGYVRRFHEDKVKAGCQESCTCKII